MSKHPTDAVIDWANMIANHVDEATAQAFLGWVKDLILTIEQDERERHQKLSDHAERAMLVNVAARLFTHFNHDAVDDYGFSESVGDAKRILSNVDLELMRRNRNVRDREETPESG